MGDQAIELIRRLSLSGPLKEAGLIPKSDYLLVARCHRELAQADGEKASLIDLNIVFLGGTLFTKGDTIHR